ncbi:sugar ABC transporter substrate-binding protein [Helcobacillus massiliensis]|uniref:Multiple sugar transport system substrate-binding protein n=1 Tax=Helcobacillus massiliensis TaxID=521392 RepID=A0A839QVE5_9MICO|nr:sugar ABC transporter substrate-binding protein [Helcobacillus massiliensis]MBB3022750.1 multiple sugar transport system substrate-binding protein [Helcobacillus massiliensis]MCT1558460.1 sugar ABC transporter substrate-binding protein [Helcobacillus massiliensis]MCT2037151.1 sugar ABC transporter substrate-binding protein [Helcobacillus massiliensis]MCT2332087.1 sugar ABC transporter substrate-binding protein [Helcobacillus massiliensis]
MVTRRTFVTSAGIAGAAGALAACSPSKSSSDGSSKSSGSDSKKLTLRIWDDVAKPAYEESLNAFTEKTGIEAAVEVVPWADYWKTLPLDIASGDAADVFWLNSASFTQYQQAGNLVDITETLGEDAAASWEKAVVELYTRDGSLWGVPQLWDSIALFFNKKLTDEANVDPTKLSFDPAAKSDPLRDAALKLTKDKAGKKPGESGFDPNARQQFGFNSAADRQAIIGPFLASNGAEWQKDDTYAFDTPEGVAAFKYMADLVNTWQVAPSAADTNPNGDFARDQFIQGKLGLFQSGPYHLMNILEGVGDSFEWGIAPMVGGPKGQKSLVHGVVAAGNAKSENQDGVKKLLEWLGSAEGQKPIGTKGVGFPGHTDVQSAFVEFWKGKGHDVQQFIEAAKDPAMADTGAKALAGLEAVMPVFQQIFAGEVPAEEGVPQAVKEGNAAMA